MLYIYIIIIFWNKLVKIVEHSCLSIQWQATPFCKRQDLWSYHFVECKSHFVEKTQSPLRNGPPRPHPGVARRICNCVLCYRIMLVIFCCEKGKRCLQIDRANLMLLLARDPKVVSLQNEWQGSAAVGSKSLFVHSLGCIL